MKRNKIARINLIALLLLGAWWFTTAILAGIPWRVTALVLPVSLGIASAALLIFGLRKSISGPAVLAGGLFAVSLLLTLQVASGDTRVWLLGWPFILGLASLGILLENLLGPGWRFSNRQAVGLGLIALTCWMAFNFPLADAVHSILAGLHEFPWLDTSKIPGVVNGQTALSGLFPLILKWR